MKNRLPSDFRFGVADSDLQVIGEKNTRDEERSEETMWSRFAKERGLDGPDAGADRYHHWRDDVRLMRDLGIRNYRTSISMSRLLTRSGGINAKAAAWYESYFQELKNAGISIFATLYHWELPQFLSEQGGWKNRLMVDWLAKHAEAVFQTLGEYIEEYFILNEPWCSAFLGYYRGIHAPGEKDMAGAFLAAHNLLLAQGAAFEKLKSLDRAAKVSTVVNVMPSYAATTSDDDVKAASIADAFHNGWFLEPLYNARYPDEGLEAFSPKLSTFGKSDFTLMNIGPRLNTLGINYYNGIVVRADPFAETRYTAVSREGEETNDLGWPVFVPPIHRDGLSDILEQVWFSYRKSGLRRMYVSENGMAIASEKGDLADTRRIAYLTKHIDQTARAIERGVPVKGFFAWTFVDNYEWAEGYKPESAFGLVHVDRKTMRRTKKESAEWLARMLLPRKTSRDDTKAARQPVSGNSGTRTPSHIIRRRTEERTPTAPPPAKRQKPRASPPQRKMKAAKSPAKRPAKRR